MMNRDPVAGLTQRPNVTTTTQEPFSPMEVPEVKIVAPQDGDEERAAIELAVRKSLEDQRVEPNVQTSEEEDEESAEIELAIKKSLEDQQASVVEIDNEASSSSDSDGKLNK